MNETGQERKVWSRELGVGYLARALEGYFEPTEKDLKLHELAMRYHAETEAYDRTVCTGPIRGGSILPVGPHEMALSAKNARRVLDLIMHEAVAAGIGCDELRGEIARCA
jgi:hypothetical protein